MLYSNNALCKKTACKKTARRGGSDSGVVKNAWALTSPHLELMSFAGESGIWPT